MTTSANPILCSRQVSQVLRNEDLLAHVFSWFGPPRYVHGPFEKAEEMSRLKTLFSACLTCRPFTKPASDVLWRHMRSLMPLFKVLPTFVKDSHDEFYTFDGAIQPEHRARLEIYARKIRILSIEQWPDLIPSHYIHRLMSTSTLPLFPALKTVNLSAKWNSHTELEQFNPLFLVDGGLLTSITIDCVEQQNQSLMTSFLLHLLGKNPNIQKISLLGDLCPGILSVLKSFRKLRVVSLSFRSWFGDISTLIQDLGNLPDLNELSLKFTNNLLNGTTSLIRGGISSGFAVLRSLTLEGTSLHLLNTLQSFHLAPVLCTISLYVIRGTPESQTCISRSIGECCRMAPNMGNLHLRAGSTINIPPEDGSNILSPFIQWRRLCLLYISPFVTSAINDDQICSVAESGAWQNLHCLYLPYPCNTGPSPSLTSLRILAQNCPKLARLSIPIDFTKHTLSSLQEERRHTRTPRSKLQGLSIVQTNATDNCPDDSHAAQMAIAVARFIEHFFPNPQCELLLMGDNLNRGPYNSQWWDVVKMNVAEYHAVRAEALAESSLLGTTT